MIDTVETFCNIRIEGIFGFMAQGRENRFDRIVTGSTRSKAIAVGFKAGLPFGFESRFDQTLACPVSHHGNAQGPVLGGAGLRNPDPTHRLYRLPKSQVVCQCEALGGSQGFYPIDPRSLLALVLLGYFPHG